MAKYINFSFEDIIIDSPHLTELHSYPFNPEKPELMTKPAYLANFLLTHEQVQVFRTTILTRLGDLPALNLHPAEISAMESDLDLFLDRITTFRPGNKKAAIPTFQHEDGYYHFKIKSQEKPAVHEKVGQTLYRLSDAQVKKRITPGNIVSVAVAVGVFLHKVCPYFSDITKTGAGTPIERTVKQTDPRENRTWGDSITEVLDMPEDMPDDSASCDDVTAPSSDTDLL